MSKANLALMVSGLASVAAVVSSIFSYLSFQKNKAPPEIFARLSKLEVLIEEEAVAAEVDFSISNRSSREITIMHCAFISERLSGGAGGYAAKPSPCNFNGKSFDENNPLVVLPG
jgi:hypothetical protein